MHPRAFSAWCAVIRGASYSRRLLVEEPDQLLAAGGRLELSDGLGLDLADSLAGDLEDVANLFERVAVPVAQAIAELDDLSLPVAERLEDLGNAVAEHTVGRADRGGSGRAVWQQVAEMAVLAVAHRPVQTDRIAAHCPYATGPVDASFAGPRGFPGGW